MKHSSYWRVLKDLVKMTFFGVIVIYGLSFWVNATVAKIDPEEVKQEYLQVHNILNAQKKIKWIWKKVVIAVIEHWFSLNNNDISANLLKNPKRLKRWKNYESESKRREEQGLYIETKNWAQFWPIDAANTWNMQHSTAVLWLIGAWIDDGIGIRGIVKNVSLMPLSVSELRGSMGVRIAIMYAVDAGANIINVSMGGTYTKQSEILPAIQYAKEKWVIVIFAAGNSWTDTSENKVDGACSETKRNEIIGVWSVNNDGKRLKWSNYGSCVDVYAMGSNIYTTLADNKYGFLEGTSLSAPIVSWIIGLGFNKYGKKSATKIYTSLKKSTKNGILDAVTYLEYLGKK